jgi:hypothetical protein
MGKPATDQKITDQTYRAQGLLKTRADLARERAGRCIGTTGD